MPDLPSPAARPLRLLYVEDNRINALLFEQAVMMRSDIELTIAEDGEQALDVATRWQPDMLVLDAHLPDMNGYDALKALRRLPGLADVPAYMCSGDALPEDLERAREAGFLGYWTKPVDIRQMWQVLDEHVAGLAAPGAPTIGPSP